jgi:predicted DNA-binding transcriptional regulator AlpA
MNADWMEETVATSAKESLIDIKGVSEWTGLSVGTLYHFVSMRKIPFVRISARCIKFDPPQIRAWIAAKAIRVRP